MWGTLYIIGFLVLLLWAGTRKIKKVQTKIDHLRKTSPIFEKYPADTKLKVKISGEIYEAEVAWSTPIYGEDVLMVHYMKDGRNCGCTVNESHIIEVIK